MGPAQVYTIFNANGSILKGIFFQLFLFLLQVLSISSRPEIWPPTGRLTPNNYLPPPRCRYEQETVYEDTLEEICTTENKEECKSEIVIREEEQVEVK